MRQAIRTRVVLAANDTFTSVWKETSANEQEQFNFVSASCFASHAGAASGFIIEETDSEIFDGIEQNTNLTTTVNSTSVSATTATSLTGIVKKLYWRIKYTNGTTLQTSFELVADVTDNSITNAAISGTSDINLKQVGGSSISLGSTVAASSIPVVIASDQTLPLPIAPSISTEIAAQVTAKLVKASVGNVLSFFISNENAAKRYFQLHNKATIPVATNVPILSIPIGAGTTNNPFEIGLGTDFFTDKGMAFSTGIGWAISTTRDTFTDSATASEHEVIVNYR